MTAAELPPDSPGHAAPMHIGILWGEGCISSTAAAVVDVLQAINMLAAIRLGAGQTPLHWHWLPLNGETTQGDMAPVPAPLHRMEPRVRGAVPVSADPSGVATASSSTGAVGALPVPSRYEVLVIPGWLVATGPQLRACSMAASARWATVLQAHVAQGGRVLAVFNGSCLLADCGLLAGRRVALPWVFAPSIVVQMEHDGWPGSHAVGPAEPVVWQRDRAWLRDGAVWTTASLQETTAAMLDVLCDTPLAAVAQAVRHVLLFDAARQLTAPSSIETTTGAPLAAGSLEQARRWLQDHRNEPYSLPATARAAATSPRTLLRWFSQVYGQTPLDYLHSLRVAQAQSLLQTTYLTVEDVARQCGYSDTGSFRKVFVRLCGVTPGAYRQQFRLRTTRRQWQGRTEPG